MTPRSRLLIACSAVLLSLAARVPAAEVPDLAKIERRIAKEPTYEGKPKYCLLVFGPKAAFHVWLVVDGDLMYVDRNGNGDLTEPGERVPVEASELRRIFSAEKIRSGARCESDVTVDQLPQGDFYQVHVKTRWTARHDQRKTLPPVAQQAGYLKFAEVPEQAPIIHFAGPLSLTLLSEVSFYSGQPAELQIGVGTPGLGEETFAYVEYKDCIPKGTHPKVEVLFPSKDDKNKAIQRSTALPYRC